MDTKTVKKTAGRKTAAKPKTKESKTDIVQQVYVQAFGKEIDVNSVLKMLKEEFITEGNKESDLKSIRLYIKPEENAAYYIINEADTSKKIQLI